MLLSSYALASVAVGVWYPLALDQKYQAWRPWRESPLWKVPSWKEVDGLKYPLSRGLPSVPAHAPSRAVGHVKLYTTAFPSGDSRCLSCLVGGDLCIESHVFNPYRLDFPLHGGPQIWPETCGCHISTFLSCKAAIIVVVLWRKVSRSWSETWKTYALARMLAFRFTVFLLCCLSQIWKKNAKEVYWLGAAGFFSCCFWNLWKQEWFFWGFILERKMKCSHE